MFEGKSLFVVQALALALGSTFNSFSSQNCDQESQVLDELMLHLLFMIMYA